MKHLFLALCLLAGMLSGHAQDTAASGALTAAEYEKAKTLSITDPDKDSYVKFENLLILDRNDFGKPYFITGDDGQKKRIDLYKLIRKEGRAELGTVIFYTTETGKRYSACLPGFKADGKIWEKYFEDIHSIDKQEKDFVLKLSYVLSKELGFQLYRAAGAGAGKDAAKDREAGTYGNDICFPGNTLVRLADGSQRFLRDLRAGDAVVTVDPQTKRQETVQVKELTEHPVMNYAITELTLLSAVEDRTSSGTLVRLRSTLLRATPNHPMVTAAGDKKIGALKEGDQVLCLDPQTDRYLPYTVWYRQEAAGGMQKVYNIVADSGNTFIMNDVMVLQKPGKN